MSASRIVPYRDFARVYDRLMDRRHVARWWAWFRKLQREHGWRFHSLADIAAGTGEAAACFRGQKLAVFAVDCSRPMLARLREKLPEARVICQDMRSLALPRKVDLAVCVFGAVHYLKNQRELRRLFSGVRRHLEDRGIFCFDCFSIRFLQTNYGGGVEVYERRDFISVWRHRWLAKARCSEILIEGIENARGKWRHHQPELHRQQGFTLAEIRAGLKAAGFRGIRIDPMEDGGPGLYGVVASPCAEVVKRARTAPRPGRVSRK